jgi:uncharacterized coiled-coil DUF342 family protein
MNKVKITYAVDLDKVPHKSQELITEAYYWLSGALSKLEQIKLDDEQENFQKILEQIDKIRRALADVDQRLDDCTAVMSGYHKAMIDLSAPQQEQHSQSPDALAEQLKALQSQLSVPAGEDNE